MIMTLEQTIEILPDHRLELALPVELPVGRARVELTVIPEKKKNSHKGEAVFGCLHQFADPAKIPDEKGAWERAVLDKKLTQISFSGISWMIMKNFRLKQKK